MHFKRDDKIASFEVVFPHKEGIYAETYRVKDADGKVRFLKLISLSRLHRSQIDNEGRVMEVEIAKQLQHHNLCQFIDSGNMIMGGQQYAWFVTEFISGETLSQRIIRDNKDLSVYEIKTIAKAVLSALSFLHAQPVPIIHNEVTTQNVLLNLVGDLSDLKLIDFGHARFLNQPPSKPSLDQLNVFYLAPERFSGVCSVQSDLYSVGIMMYQLLYGGLPWFVDTSRVDGQELVEVLLREREKVLDLPNIEIYELDDQLRNVIAKALSYEAEDRFQTAQEFIGAIDGDILVDRQSVKAKQLSQQEQGKPRKKPTKKKGQGFAAVAGMVQLKQQMQEEVIEPLHNPEEYQRYGVTIPNGMLLYGPPGCGKTFFAKHFAEEVGFHFICVTPADLKSRYVNAAQENIAQMFKEAEENAPTVIFIDEMNELVPNRDDPRIHEMSRSAVNEMLAQMDRTGERASLW